MSQYVTTLSGHFRITKDNETLIATTPKEPGFEQTYPWPEEIDPDDDNVKRLLFDSVRSEIMSDFQDFQD
jgi:hypothetical protein